MAHRRLVLVTVTAAALAVTGCSSSSKKDASHTGAAHTTPVLAGTNSTPPATAGSAADTTPDAATATLSTDQCLELAEAQLDVATATKADDARKAADIVEKYHPPSGVKDAVEHFVTTVGVQFDDPKAAADTQLLKSWVDKVCPT